jgi:hypothetical protein
MKWGRWDTVAALVGLTSATLLLLVVVSPDLLRFAILGVELEALDQDLFRLAVAGAVGLVLVVSALQGSQTTGEDITDLDPLCSRPPEDIHGRHTRYAGAETDELLEARADWDTLQTQHIQERLRDTLVPLYAVSNRCSRTDAEIAIDTGEWTGDTRAAAFVGSEASRIPFHLRLWDYLRPGHPLEHRLQHAITEIEVLSTSEEADNNE